MGNVVPEESPVVAPAFVRLSSRHLRFVRATEGFESEVIDWIWENCFSDGAGLGHNRATPLMRGKR